MGGRAWMVGSCGEIRDEGPWETETRRDLKGRTNVGWSHCGLYD